MKYSTGSNRVYRIDHSGETYHYVAPDAPAAIVEHQKMCPDLTSVDHLKIEEVTPEKNIRVVFDDPTEAVGAMLGMSINDRARVHDIIGAYLSPIGGIWIGLAADAWARTIDEGKTKLLSAPVL